jgi:DNA (cytosine-5)-methyltransferase 1
MNHLDLFSGIGGFAVALDLCQVPIEHRYYSDIEEHANAVYAKNFPTAAPLGDIRSFSGRNLRGLHPTPWILTGGFPCQDISDAGHRKGLEGKRSGLWYEMLRIITELRPELVLVENVAALARRGLVQVLQGLDEAGYDAEWQTLSAQDIGALHRRKRLWIVAYPRNSDRHRLRTALQQSSCARNLGDGAKPSGTTHALLTLPEWETAKTERSFLAQPLVARKTDGLRSWIHRNRSLGNAIVPQCAAKVLNDFISDSAGGSA